MVQIFGWEFKRKQEEDQFDSFVPKTESNEDGAVVISAGGAYGTYVDLDGTVRTEAELITKYREMSLHPEVDAAVEEITNEAINMDEDQVVRIILDDIEYSPKIKKSISESFEKTLGLLDFNNRAHDIFRKWYIDGRTYYHVLIDEKNTSDGIKELRYIDPRKLRKIREQTRKKVQKNNMAIDFSVPKTTAEYYVYNEKGFNYTNKGAQSASATASNSGLKIAKDAVVYAASGLTDAAGTMILSYLHKAIKPLNQLRTLEDSTVIYRISRAPERRIWYIDVGNLPKMKAEQYVREIMTKHKNRLVYDANTGDIKDDRKFMTMLEDYWIPRREGGRGTEVSTLPAGQNLGEMADVEYFQKKLYRSLNVPTDRLDAQSQFNLGRSSEITREELKFGKFVDRLRIRFCSLFLTILEKEVVLKNIMSIEDWNLIRDKIKFDFVKDSYFTELKNSEILQGRMQTLASMENYIGKYYSNDWVRKNILKQDDELIEKMNEQIMEEMDNEIYNPPMDQQIGMDQQQADQGAAVAPQQDDQSGSAGGENDRNKLVNAKNAYLRLIDKKNKSIQDISQLQSAAVTIAKGKDEDLKSMLQVRQQK
jgi:hypothetical protein